MNKPTTAHEAMIVLSSLHQLAEANLPVDLGVLAGRLGWGVGRVVRVLAHLEKKGLADRARCRLTLAGLAFAVALDAARGVAMISAA